MLPPGLRPLPPSPMGAQGWRPAPPRLGQTAAPPRLGPAPPLPRQWALRTGAPPLSRPLARARRRPRERARGRASPSGRALSRRGGAAGRDSGWSYPCPSPGLPGRVAAPPLQRLELRSGVGARRFRGLAVFKAPPCTALSSKAAAEGAAAPPGALNFSCRGSCSWHGWNWGCLCAPKISLSADKREHK